MINIKEVKEAFRFSFLMKLFDIVNSYIYIQKNNKNRPIQALHGIELFDNVNNCVLKAGFFYNPNAKTREFLLEEGERIVGIVSRIEKRFAE